MKLVLGAGGFIGSAIVRAAAANGCDVEALVRSTPKPARKLDHPDRDLRIHYGDARQIDFALDPSVAENIRERVTTLFISVGAVDFDAGPNDMRSGHIAPVQGALAFARTCPSLERVVYISSLAAVGETDERLKSHEFPAEVAPRNYYEWGKCEAERLVRGSGLPAAIVRPAQVLSSRDGTFVPDAPMVLLESLSLMVAGWPLLIGPDTTYWCAPVDFVAEVALQAATSSRRSFWAVDPASPRLEAILDLLAFRYGVAPRRIQNRRLSNFASAIVKPQFAGSSMSQRVLRYSSAQYSLDLSCLRELINDGVLTPPETRDYVAHTIDAEIDRKRRIA